MQIAVYIRPDAYNQQAVEKVSAKKQRLILGTNPTPIFKSINIGGLIVDDPIKKPKYFS